LPSGPILIFALKNPLETCRNLSSSAVLPDAIFGYLFNSSLEVEFREGKGGFSIWVFEGHQKENRK
jgi:hypothetical protein